MDKTVAVKWMQCFDQRVEAEKDHLSELDGPIGDGDHGANLARAFQSAFAMITVALICGAIAERVMQAASSSGRVVSM